MSDLPSAGAKLELDLSEWESNWSSVMGDAAELQSTIDDLSGSVDVSIDLSTTGDDSVDEIEALDGETISPEIDTTESEDSKAVREGITFLATMKKIEIAIDVIGTAIDFVKDVGSMVVTPFLDVEDAVAKINAQTGGTGIEDLGQFIRDMQAADLGSSVDQIAETVIHAKQLGLPIQEAATAALTFTHAWSQEDPTKVIDALGSAIQTGIVDNMQEASDLMAVFFQQGGNIGGDALQVVQSSAQSWSDMGLNMSQALSLMDSLQNGTGATATEAQKMLQTFDDALTTAANDPNSQQAKLLSMIGVDNPKEQGKAIGAETFDGFAEAFSSQSSDTQDLLSGLFFGKGGKKFTGAIGNMSSEEDFFKDYKDAAADAATEVDNSLRGAIDDFITELNAKFAELLSSDKIDLPGKIKAIKEGLQRGIAEIQSGGTIGEGLEVALGIPGLSDTLNTFIGNFERIIGNLEITFLQLVAAIQDITGHGEEAQATRQIIFDRSLGQLEFDLKLANPEDVDAMIDQAVGRGLNATNIGEALNTALNESIASSDFDQGANIIQGLMDRAKKDGKDPAAWNDLAADYVTKLSGGFDNALSAGNLDLAQKFLKIEPNAKIPGLDEAVAGFQKQLSDAFTPQNRAGDQGNPFLSGLGAGIGKEGATAQGGLAGMGTVIQGFKTTMEEAQAAAATATDDISTNFDHTSTAVTGSLDAVNTALDTTGMSVEGLDMRVVNALTGNTVTASFEAVASAADSAFPGVITWFQQAGAAAAAFDNMVSLHLRSVVKQLSDLNFLAQQVISNVTSAQQLGGSGGGGGGTTNNVTNNVSVTNNVPNGAAAAASSYTLAASLRPGGA